MNHLIKLRWRFFVSCLLWNLLLQMTTVAQVTPSALVLPNHAPVDFNKFRKDVPKGNLETITYNSKSIGVDRKDVVCTPPNYDPGKRYPVLCLMHGIGGNETHWTTLFSANKIHDNLIVDKKTVPMQ
jgi:enterochelin esterase-like enzyme